MPPRVCCLSAGVAGVKPLHVYPFAMLLSLPFIQTLVS